MNKINKIFNFDIKQVGPDEDRVLRFVGSDETPDRDNDILEVAGWKLDDYLKNPVFMWAHRYDEPPIGKAVNVMTDMATKKLLFDVKFATAEEYPFADTIYRLYKGGYLNATSVGFRGIKYKTRDDESVLEKPEWQRGRRYMEQSLLELSAVPVPCNPNALVEVRGKGFTDEEVDRVFTEELKEVEIIVDTNTKEVFVQENGQKTAKVKISPEYYEQIAMSSEEFQEKSGATLSAKNKKELNEIHEIITKCNDRFRKFIDSAGVTPSEPEGEGRAAPEDGLAVKVELSEEFKQALEEIKSQVLLLSQKGAPKDIDLDAIEWTPAKKDVAQDELNIEPGELKTMIAEIIQEQLQGGNINEN